MTDTNGVDLPHIPDGLLQALDAKFPDRCPHPADSDRAIWMKAGERGVVAYLIDQRRRQKEAARSTGLSGLFLGESV